MDQVKVRGIVGMLISPCPCGSGKMYSMCCGKEDAILVAGEDCPCESGKKVKDCCMKRQEAHGS